MSQPRRLESGRTHAVTRRAVERRPILNPRDEVVQIVGYALGRAAEENPGVRLHAFMQHTTHVHENATDRPAPNGHSSLPRFHQHLFGLAARAINARFGRGGALFEQGSYRNVEVHDRAALEQQLVYTWVQVVKDGIVDRLEDWPGVMVLPEHWGTELAFDKPKSAFFGGKRPKHVREGLPTAEEARLAELHREEREALEEDRRRRREQREQDARRGRSKRRQKQLDEARERRRSKRDRASNRKERAPRPERVRSKLPDRVVVRPVPPPGYEHLSLPEVRDHFRRLLDEGLAKVREDRRLQGLRAPIGIEKILLEDPRRSIGDCFPAFSLNPRIACKDRETRIEAIKGLQAWRREVHEKRRLWREGNRRVVFPHGTFGLPCLHGARVADAPSDGDGQRAPP